MASGSLMMHRFRLLGFYVAGMVVVVALAIGAVSLRRTADDHEGREAPEQEAVAPETLRAKSIDERKSSERMVRRQVVSDLRFKI
jgi:hypothetical protein